MTTEHAFILVLAGFWTIILFVCFVFALRLRGQQLEKRCKHTSRITTFHGMEQMRDLFNGRMSIEEYRNYKGKFGIESKCCDCGEKL